MPQRFNAALTSCNYPNNPEKLLRDENGDFVLYAEYEKLLKAVEFAEYMAKRAEQYINANNEASQCDDELEQEYSEEALNKLEESTQVKCESFSALQSAIYEFRKRAERIGK